jgi:hypothetical protein
MRKAVIIILALVVALGTLPVTFACYNGGWGNCARFWRPQQPVYCCPTNCKVTFTLVHADDNELTFTEPKEVAQTTACIKDCGKKLAITINNAYPGYAGIVDFCVKNTGTMAATITGITPDYPDPVYLQIYRTGEVQVDTVIQQCETKCGKLVIGGIPQLEDAQNRTFTFDITIDYECTCVPNDCETAFAYKCGYATCFSHWGFSRWGWTNGPLQPGCYYMGIYAGAGSCNPFDGERVGWLKVEYDGSTAVVSYHMNMYKGYKMTETHLYVGNDYLPRKNGDFTVAPGQYPYKHDLNNTFYDHYVVTGLSGDIYIVAHAEVCR